MDTLEQINQLATQFGWFQTIILFLFAGVVAYIVFSVRSMYVLSRGTSKQGETTALLAKQLETNSEKSEERWHGKMERYEDSRTETNDLINSLQSELREVTNKNSYGEGVIVTLNEARKEDRERAEGDKNTMLGEINLLKQQVAENKRTIQELLNSSALKDKVIAEKDERLAENNKQLTVLKVENRSLKSQLAKLKEENNKPQLPDEPSNK